LSLKLTGKPLFDSHIADETAVISLVRVTYTASLVDSTQVQVDSIIQVLDMLLTVTLRSVAT